jgi:hypothetical protein
MSAYVKIWVHQLRSIVHTSFSNNYKHINISKHTNYYCQLDHTTCYTSSIHYTHLTSYVKLAMAVVLATSAYVKIWVHQLRSIVHTSFFSNNYKHINISKHTNYYCQLDHTTCYTSSIHYTHLTSFSLHYTPSLTFHAYHPFSFRLGAKGDVA